MGGEDFQAGRKAEPQPCPSNFPIFSFIKSSFAHIATDTLRRTSRALFNVQATVTGGVLLLAKGASSSSDGYPRLNSSRPSYAEFQLSEADPGTDEGQRVLADVNNFVPTSSQDWNQWGLWVKRAESIRSSGRPDYCVGNLSIALSEVGAAYQAGASGATTLLTLLPTAGALIGAPSKELWVLYKLVPIAGLLSMLLSLGGNIMPMEVNSYERMDTFTYSGMMASRPDEMITAPTAKHAASGGSEAEFFADEVHSRAMDHGGSKKSIAVLCGILLQLLWLGCIVGACWFTVSGGIVVWWCTMWPWMFVWYALVAASSLLENLAGVPFTRQWTIRVSRAPKIHISDDAPWVIPEPDTLYDPQSPPVGAFRRTTSTSFPDAIQHAPVKRSSTDPDEVLLSTARVSTGSSHVSGAGSSGQYAPVPLGPQLLYQGEILTRLERGYNTHGRIVMDQSAPWSASNNPFYVIISVKGISNPHAVLRVFSKFFSVAVFTFGTALFASTTLITILVALTSAALVVIAGVFGRVTAMWMASEIMMNKPVIHRVVKGRVEAELYIEAMLRKPGMCCEILGHVIVDGRCVKRYGNKFRWSKLLGVLASPYDLSKLAMPAFPSKV